MIFKTALQIVSSATYFSWNCELFGYLS